MPAIAPEPTRRALLAAGLAAIARAADPSTEAWEVVTDMATALGRGSGTEFLAFCDPGAPGYAVLRSNVAALLAAAEVESGIDPVENSGDDNARVVRADWQLHLIDRTGLGRVTRRREVVTFRMEKRARRWKVTALTPAAFFAPPSAGVDLAHKRGSGGALR
jgi:hypothetical protein